MTVKNEEMSEKKKLSKKSKVIISIVSILIVLAIIISSCFIWQNSQAIKLIANTKTIEYGESYTPNLKDFVAEKNVNKYSIDGSIPNETGKEYPAIGEYKLTVKKNKESQEVVLKVKDTVAPAFSEDVPTTISATLNTPLDDVTVQFKDKVTDLDDVKVTVNSANVNYGVAGEYKSELIATDESGNTSKKEIMVVVNEKNQMNSSNGNKKPSGNSSSSNSKPSNNKPSNGGSSSSSKPSKPSNGNSGSSSQPSKPSTGGTSSGTTTKPSHCTNNGNHSMSCGNIGKWFSSKKEIERYWEQIDQKYFQQYENGQITWEEYIKKAPSGYECWSCSYCGKWTGNFKYR